MNVSATSRRASVAASVVEPAQAFLLRIASAPHTSVGARSSLNRLRRARVRYKLPLKNYIIYIRNQNSRWIPKKNWRDRKRASLAAEFRRVKSWCGRRDSNPHALRRHPLKMVRLPVPPLPHEEGVSLDCNRERGTRQESVRLGLFGRGRLRGRRSWSR